MPAPARLHDLGRIAITLALSAAAHHVVRLLALAAAVPLLSRWLGRPS